MTTGRINQIAFGKKRMIVKSIRFGKESTPSHKRTEQTFEAKSAEWSPTSDRIRPLHGCLFEMQIPRDGLRCVCIHEMSLCTRGRQASAMLSSPRSHSVVARLQFSKGYATRHKVCHAVESKSVSPQSTRKGGGMSGFRTRGTFELAPYDAQSPSEWYVHSNA